MPRLAFSISDPYIRRYATTDLLRDMRNGEVMYTKRVFLRRSVLCPEFCSPIYHMIEGPVRYAVRVDIA